MFQASLSRGSVRGRGLLGYASGRVRFASTGSCTPVMLRQLLANPVACRGQHADDEKAEHPDQNLAEHAAPPVWRA